MNKVLIILYGDINRDVRVKRQYSALKDNYQISLAGDVPLKDSNIPFYQIREKLSFSLKRKLYRLILFFFRRHEAFYWDEAKLKFIESVNREHFDVIIANDINTLPMALRIAEDGSNTKVYFDAHEYHPREFENSWGWRFFHQSRIYYLCNNYIKKADVFTTVCSSIAKEYKKEFGIEPKVITNAAAYHNLKPLPIRDGKIRIIHHGAAIRPRKLEYMIEAVHRTNRTDLSIDFMLTGDQEYIKELKFRTEIYEGMRIIPPVPVEQICEKINEYDVGIFLLPPTTFNYRYALPNKLFEYLQARLAVVVSPNPEMKEFVEKYGIGEVADDYSVESMVKVLKSLEMNSVQKFKNASHKIAREVSSLSNIEDIRSIVNQLS